MLKDNDTLPVPLNSVDGQAISPEDIGLLTEYPVPSILFGDQVLLPGSWNEAMASLFPSLASIEPRDPAKEDYGVTLYRFWENRQRTVVFVFSLSEFQGDASVHLEYIIDFLIIQ